MLDQKNICLLAIPTDETNNKIKDSNILSTAFL